MKTFYSKTWDSAWVVHGDISDAAQKKYPNDAEEIPNPPADGYVWDGLEWVKDETSDELRALAQRQFFWLMARYGYDEVLEAVISEMKGHDPDFAARLMALARAPGVVSFDQFMGYLSHEKITPLLPDGFDASEETMTQHWQAALNS